MISKLCKSNRNCAWNLAFPVFFGSPIVWNMCENLPYESDAYISKWCMVVVAAAAAVVAAVVVDLFVGLLVYPIFIVFLKRWILKAGKFVSAFLRFHIRQVRFCLQCLRQCWQRQQILQMRNILECTDTSLSLLVFRDQLWCTWWNWYNAGFVIEGSSCAGYSAITKSPIHSKVPVR